jgi:DNA-binding CsgD family transcriptional regulator
MAISRQDETDLLTALHEGVLESPLWSTFLSRLRSRTVADYAGLILRRGDGSPEVSEFASARHVRQDLKQIYLGGLYRLDPVLNQPLRPNRVYALDEILDVRNADHQRFIRECMAPAMIRFARLMRVSEVAGYDAWLVIAREKGDFDASETALLSALAPHVAIAVRTYAALQRERLRADISGEAIQRLNFGWITLDAGGVIVDYDDQADRLLRQSTALRKTAAGRLVPTSRQAEGALARLLRQVSAGETVRSQAIHLSDEPWLDMLVASIRDQPFSRSKAPVLVAYVHGEERSSADRADQLMDLFALTRSEARLAIALSHGRSIAEAAKDLGLTLETTRLYSKRIYAKTGTKGQADLVRLVLASVVALA